MKKITDPEKKLFLLWVIREHPKNFAEWVKTHADGTIFGALAALPVQNLLDAFKENPEGSADVLMKVIDVQECPDDFKAKWEKSFLEHIKN